MGITNRNLDQQLEYTYKQIDIDVSATIDRFEINLVGRELYYESGDIDLRIYFQDKSRGFITLQPLRRITFADNKAFTRVIVETTTTSATKSTLVVTSGDLIIQDYTAEVTGTSSFNLAQIGGSSTPTTDLTNILNYSDAKDAERVGVNIAVGGAGSTTAYTVAVGKVLLIHSGWSLAVTGFSGFEGIAYSELQDSSSSLIYRFNYNFDKSAPTTEAVSTAFSFPVPIRANAGDKIVGYSSQANFTLNAGIYGTLIDV
tara:strand:+ start:296 stop:1069 length:774 start_codon:yes stop_codon:yes gene_type:complete